MWNVNLEAVNDYKSYSLASGTPGISDQGSVTKRMGWACWSSRSGDVVGLGGYSASTMKSWTIRGHQQSSKLIDKHSTRRTLIVKVPTLNPPVRTLSLHLTSPSQLSVSQPFISENILEGSGGSCLKVPSPTTQSRHDLWPYTETIIWRRRKTRINGLFSTGGLRLIGYRWFIVGCGGSAVNAFKEGIGAESWIWNGMESVMAKIWAEGMKS